jgi:hypothetical protein
MCTTSTRMHSVISVPVASHPKPPPRLRPLWSADRKSRHRLLRAIWCVARHAATTVTIAPPALIAGSRMPTTTPHSRGSTPTLVASGYPTVTPVRGRPCPPWLRGATLDQPSRPSPLLAHSLGLDQAGAVQRPPPPKPVTRATTVASLASLTTSPLDVSHRPYRHLCLPPCFHPLLTIFLDQTANRKATVPLPRPRRTVETGALLDTGSLAGNVISQHVVTHLQGAGLSYLALHPKTVVVVLIVPAIVASFFST